MVRATRIAFTAAALAAVLALLLAAAGDQRRTAFSLDVSNNVPSATLGAGEALCEGPITARAAFTSFAIWASPAAPLDVSLRVAAPAAFTIARLLAPHPTSTGELAVPLGGVRVPAGATIRVCVQNAGTRDVALEGGQSNSYSGTLWVGGRAISNTAIAMLFLAPHGASLLSLIPTVFARAGLFKLGFVGPWTYWLLAAALLGAFGLALAAVSAAARSETADDEPERGEPPANAAPDTRPVPLKAFTSSVDSRLARVKVPNANRS